MNPRWTVLAIGIGIYTLLAVIAMVRFGWDSHLDAALPALAIGCYMEYVYLRCRGTGSHTGLALSGVGWLAVGIAFLLRGPGEWLSWWRLVFVLIGFGGLIGGGLKGFQETRDLALRKRYEDFRAAVGTNEPMTTDEDGARAPGATS